MNGDRKFRMRHTCLSQFGLTSAVSSRGERMRTSGLLYCEVRRQYRLGLLLPAKPGQILRVRAESGIIDIRVLDYDCEPIEHRTDTVSRVSEGLIGRIAGELEQDNLATRKQTPILHRPSEVGPQQR